MKRSKILYTLMAMLMVVTAIYAIDYKSNRASVISLPDFKQSATTKEREPVATIQQLNDAMVNIADKTTPSVVTVRVTQTVEIPESPFSRFFGMPDQEGERVRRGLGSGVIVSEDGYILTNNHVVEGAEEITVDLSNGESYTGKVIGRDPLTDIAVIKIDAENLQAIPIGDSDDVRVGEMVLAIGSPLSENLAHSVSMGIISAKERAIGILQEQGGYETFLQTDAAINPGNSGGALVNMDGELIGINSAIASRTGGNDGIGFAVPSNLAKSVMQSLITDGEVERGFLGISWGGDVDRPMARALGLNDAQGIIVGSVQPGGPADEAGLREGDVIQTLNGERIKGWSSFRAAIGTASPGDEITLGINRNGERMELDVTLGKSSRDVATSIQDSDEDLAKTLGFRVDELTAEIARQLDLSPGQNGILVTAVSQGSNAYRQGLRRGAVITKINKQPVENLSDFREIMNDIAEEDQSVVLLQVLYQSTNQYIAFEL